MNIYPSNNELAQLYDMLVEIRMSIPHILTLAEKNMLNGAHFDPPGLLGYNAAYASITLPDIVKQAGELRCEMINLAARLDEYNAI